MAKKELQTEDAILKLLDIYTKECEDTLKCRTSKRRVRYVPSRYDRKAMVYESNQRRS